MRMPSLNGQSINHSINRHVVMVQSSHGIHGTTAKHNAFTACLAASQKLLLTERSENVFDPVLQEFVVGGKMDSEVTNFPDSSV